ncbi:MAG: hypothetical protein WCJ64_19985 [Rhodospirillaceae bacterium]
MEKVNSDQAFGVTYRMALKVAEKHIKMAIKEGGLIGPYVAAAMIETAVNAAYGELSNAELVEMLRDLADQVEMDAKVGLDSEMTCNRRILA